MILIDFPAGAHGNYLEYMCNRFLAGVETNASPFKSSGVSHAKEYYTEPVFKQKHYFIFARDELVGATVVSIQWQKQHLLPYMSTCFLRAGEAGIDARNLEQYAYRTLSRTNPGIVAGITEKYITPTIVDGYRAIKDSSWPEVNTVEDYKRLPDSIRAELENVHGFEAILFDEDNPQCPRWILRDMFYHNFRTIENSGFWDRHQEQESALELAHRGLVVDYYAFYNMDTFLDMMTKIAEFTGYSFEPTDAVREIHQQFLSNQPFKRSHITCNNLIMGILNGENFELPELDVMQEGYILAELCRQLGRQVNGADCKQWFHDSDELKTFVLEGAWTRAMDSTI